MNLHVNLSASVGFQVDRGIRWNLFLEERAGKVGKGENWNLHQFAYANSPIQIWQEQICPD